MFIKSSTKNSPFDHFPKSNNEQTYHRRNWRSWENNLCEEDYYRRLRNEPHGRDFLNDIEIICRLHSLLLERYDRYIAIDQSDAVKEIVRTRHGLTMEEAKEVEINMRVKKGMKESK